MKIEIRQRDKRALVILGVAVVLFLLANQVLLPAYDWLAEAPESARQKEDELERYRRAVARRGLAMGVIEEVEAATDRLRAQLVAGGGNAQGVRLQTLIENAAEEAGVVVRQRNAVETRDLADAPYREVSMGLNFEALPSELAAFLSRLRTDPTHLAVTRLQITPIDQATEVPEDGILGRGLQVTMTVTGVAPMSSSEDVSEEEGA